MFDCGGIIGGRHFPFPQKWLPPSSPLLSMHPSYLCRRTCTVVNGKSTCAAGVIKQWYDMGQRCQLEYLVAKKRSHEFRMFEFRLECIFLLFGRLFQEEFILLLGLPNLAYFYAQKLATP